MGPTKALYGGIRRCWSVPSTPPRSGFRAESGTHPER